jgi:hypothetical protein
VDFSLCHALAGNFNLDFIVPHYATRNSDTRIALAVSYAGSFRGARCHLSPS